jgi:catechol 2,3-dioxygenase-like lactoylglutathione lyase family enzyme
MANRPRLAMRVADLRVADLRVADLRVADLARSVAFYRAQIGFTLADYQPGPTWR